MTTAERPQRYDLSLPADIHWELVKLGAISRLDYESYAEQLLIKFVEHSRERIKQQSATGTNDQLDKQTAD